MIITIQAGWLRALDAIGAPGLAGCALIIASAAIYVGWIEPQRAHRDAAQAKAQALQLRGAKPGDGPAVQAGVPEQLRTFYGFFPDRQTAPDWLARIHAAAAKEGLALVSGEYRLNHERGAKLARYQLMLPVSGSYVQIRRFVAAVLAQIPPAALEDIALKRESVGDPRLEARIRLTLFLADAE